MNDVIGAVADPRRRQILQLLQAGPLSAGEIAAHFPVTRSAISQHLGVLLDAALVEVDKRGRQRIYRCSPGGPAAVRQALATFWTDEVDDLAADAAALAAPHPTQESA